MINKVLDRVNLLVEEYDLPKNLIEKTVYNLSNNKVVFIIMSGKFGSGKDTIALNLINELEVSKNNNSHESFGKYLKIETDQIISIIKKSNNFDEALNQIMSNLKSIKEPTIRILESLYPDVKSGLVNTSTDRTPSTRLMLQLWGTDVRRTQDDKYWVKKAVKSSFEKLSKGQSVYITDARFPNEAKAAEDTLAFLIRLEISNEEQEKRILERDGIKITSEMRGHISEVALDDYDFPFIINSDGKTISEVVHIARNEILNGK